MSPFPAVPSRRKEDLKRHRTTTKTYSHGSLAWIVVVYETWTWH